MLILSLVLIAILVTAGVYWIFMSPYSQIFGAYPFKGMTTQKVIALTFDDGPNEPFTSEIVDFLNDKAIKATFFQVGRNVERYPQTTDKIFQSGHTIGNHSLSHEFHKYVLNPSFEYEIQRTQAILTKHIGHPPALFRSPWLWRQPLLFKTLHKYGLHPISGEFCHTLEVLQIDSKRIAKAALAKAKPGSIIIFHDGFDGRGGNRSQTVEAVKLVVGELMNKNYSFVTVDELLGIPPYQE